MLLVRLPKKNCLQCTHVTNTVTAYVKKQTNRWVGQKKEVLPEGGLRVRREEARFISNIGMTASSFTDKNMKEPYKSE